MRLNDIPAATALDGSERLLGLHAGAAALIPAARLGRRAGRLQLVTTGARQAYAFEGNGAHGRSDTRIDGRFKIRTGPFGVTGLRAILANWYDGNGETEIPNAVQVDLALEGLSPVFFQPFYFGGAKGVAMPAGAQSLVSDALPVSLDADTLYYLRASASVDAVTKPIPRGWNGGYAGDYAAVSAAATGQAYGTGALARPSGGADFTGGFGPLAIIGVPTQPYPAVALQGDSIFNGTGDVGDGVGNIGWGGRGLSNVPWGAGTWQLPYVNIARGGDALFLNQMTASYRKFAVYPYCTHLLCNLGTNDIQSGRPLAQMQADVQAIWRQAKNAGLNVAHCKIMPRTTSTDGWATAANQTPVSGFAAGGVRDQFNAWLDTQAGQGLLDTVIDPNAVVEDPANPSKWMTNGTANYNTYDGVHPSSVLHVAASALVRSWASGLSVA